MLFQIVIGYSDTATDAFDNEFDSDADPDDSIFIVGPSENHSKLQKSIQQASLAGNVWLIGDGEEG